MFVGEQLRKRVRRRIVPCKLPSQALVFSSNISPALGRSAYFGRYSLGSRTVLSSSPRSFPPSATALKRLRSLPSQLISMVFSRLKAEYPLCGRRPSCPQSCSRGEGCQRRTRGTALARRGAACVRRRVGQGRVSGHPSRGHGLLLRERFGEESTRAERQACGRRPQRYDTIS